MLDALASQGLALDVELRASEMDHVPIRNFSTEKQFFHEPFWEGSTIMISHSATMTK